MTGGRDELKPIDPAVAAKVADYDDDAREWFWERAAIREFEGGLSRQQAEQFALEDTERRLKNRTFRLPDE
ncbi:hypothetical protein BCh11DRAFT_04954 [Burkholderia sp. Ch1-1]|nr:hypothetical protein BCh11DRAFT_04954 [Burkholderia sp. Ch1-1]